MTDLQFYLAMGGAIVLGLVIGGVICWFWPEQSCYKESLGYNCKHRPGECGDE